MTRAFLICFAIAIFGLLPASNTRAQNYGNVVSVSVIEGGKTQNGTVLAALHLKLADGWKTYWRAPGDAGIPPSFSWTGSRNIRNVQITWPTPEVFHQYGMRSIGYQNQLVLPLEITPADPSAPVKVKGRMDLGVCLDVCIPSTVRFNETVMSDAARSPTIAAALAARPFTAQEAGVRRVTCSIRPTENGVEVTAKISMPSAGSVEEAVVEPGAPEIWASDPTTKRSGDVLTLTSTLVHVDGGAFGLDRSDLRFTILGNRHAVDIRGCDAG